MPVLNLLSSTLITPKSEWRATPPPPTVWDVVLREGTEAHVRAIGPDDRPGVADFVARLSFGSLHQRFFAAIRPELAVEELAEPGRRGERQLLGLFLGPGDGYRLIGHAVYDRDLPLGDSAEAAFVVDDAFQGRGVATTLLSCLAEIATERGIAHLRAVVQAENHGMLAVFRGCGLPLEEVPLGSVVHARLATTRPIGRSTPGVEVRAIGRCRVRRVPQPG